VHTLKINLQSNERLEREERFEERVDLLDFTALHGVALLKGLQFALDAN